MKRLICSTLLAAAWCAGNSWYTEWEPPDYAGSPGGTILTGQDGWYNPVAGSADFRVMTYAGNTANIPNHPIGGGQQFAVGISQGGTALARAQKDFSFAEFDIWEVQFDMAVRFNGQAPSADFLGSFSLQPSASSRFFQTLYRWVDNANPVSWHFTYVYFDQFGTQTPLPGTSPGPAWDNLLPDRWYRTRTRWQRSTNQIIQIEIVDLVLGSSSVVNPNGWYLAGGANPTLPEATAVRFFAGGANTGGGNTTAIDNVYVQPEPATLLALGAGIVAIALRRRRK